MYTHITPPTRVPPSGLKWQIDTLRFPLVRIRYPPCATPDEIVDYVAALRDLCRRGRHSTVIDLRWLRVEAITARNRKIIAESVDRIAVDFPGMVISEAVVVDSALLRGVFTAYHWLRTAQRFESRAFDSPADAEAWTWDRLRRAGVPRT